MFRRILLALADDETSMAASEITLDLAHQYNAAVTSLATVDVPGVSSMAISSGLGATYYAYELVAELDQQARDQAKERSRAFLESAREAHIEHIGKVGEGVPWECLEMESLYHDLVVVGRKAHFRFGNADDTKVPGRNLRKLLDHAACPLLCVSTAPLGTGPVLIGLDGRPPSARALQQYLRSRLLPEAEIVAFHCDEHAESAERPDMQSVERYANAHGRHLRVVTRTGAARQEILALTQELKPALVVVGPHGKSRLAEWALGNTTIELLSDTDWNLYVGN